jgi:branched-chain amino acid aminotransferase
LKQIIIEKEYFITEIIEALKEKRILEIFGCGTAAAVCPVKGISYKGTLYSIPINEKTKSGPLTAKIYKNLYDI